MQQPQPITTALRANETALVMPGSRSEARLLRLNDESRTIQVSPVVRVVNPAPTEGLVEVIHFQQGSAPEVSKGFHEGVPVQIDLRRGKDFVDPADLLPLRRMYQRRDPPESEAYINTVALMVQGSVCPMMPGRGPAGEVEQLLPGCGTCLSNDVIERSRPRDLRGRELTPEEVQAYAAQVTDPVIRALSRPFTERELASQPTDVRGIRMYKLECSGFHSGNCGAFFLVVLPGTGIPQRVRYFVLRSIREEQIQMSMLLQNRYPVSPDVLHAVKWSEVPHYGEIVDKVTGQSLGCKVEVTPEYLRNLVTFLLRKGYVVKNTRPTPQQLKLFAEHMLVSVPTPSSSSSTPGPIRNRTLSTREDVSVLEEEQMQSVPVTGSGEAAGHEEMEMEMAETVTPATDYLFETLRGIESH